MTKKVITWVDLQGRYRVTSPAYNDAKRPPGETEDECIERVWAKLVAVGGYGIPLNHPRFMVEDADQRERLEECCGTYFRYVGKPDAAGKHSAIGGAWEMDVDGRPKVNMTKARAIHMDCIREARNVELITEDTKFTVALKTSDTVAQQASEQHSQVLRDIPQTFSLSGQLTPKDLKAAWPAELPTQEG
jgi:hypothetical protein